MFSLTGFNVRFTPRLGMSLLAILAIILFVRLGLWQVQRANEKKQMLVAHHQLAKQAPIAWQSSKKLPQQYQPLKITGKYIAKTLLLDNQHYQHQFGYQVISPLMLADGKVILIDRGWVAGDVTRQTLPRIIIPDGPIEAIGSAYYPSSKNWLLGQMVEKEEANVTVIELIDPKLIAQFLHKSLYPFIIRLDNQADHGFVREWAIVSMPPERHYAYALQWFAMALVILIIFIALNLTTKKKHENCKA